jgi:signal peptidase I
MQIAGSYHAVKAKWDRATEGPGGSVIYIAAGFIIALLIHATLGFVLHTTTPVVAVFSESMVPTLQKGDMIIVYNDNNITAGDIIVFDSPYFQYPIIHRAIDISDGKIKTKGDHNPVMDPWTIDPSAVHGKAGIKIPLLGWVKIAFSSVVH